MLTTIEITINFFIARNGTQIQYR